MWTDKQLRDVADVLAWRLGPDAPDLSPEARASYAAVTSFVDLITNVGSPHGVAFAKAFLATCQLHELHTQSNA